MNRTLTTRFVSAQFDRPGRDRFKPIVQSLVFPASHDRLGWLGMKAGTIKALSSVLRSMAADASAIPSTVSDEATKRPERGDSNVATQQEDRRYTNRVVEPKDPEHDGVKNIKPGHRPSSARPVRGALEQVMESDPKAQELWSLGLPLKEPLRLQVPNETKRSRSRAGAFARSTAALVSITSPAFRDINRRRDQQHSRADDA
jgi:hypothetical protein